LKGLLFFFFLSIFQLEEQVPYWLIKKK